MYRTSRTIIKQIVPLLAGCLLTNSARTIAQDFDQVIQTRFNAYREKAVAEKLYVHTDKQFYLAGEILWFKLYYVDGTSNKSFNLSKVAYVELLEKEHKPVMQGKIALENGKGSGSFYIPSSIAAGNYVLRAYTNWMKNFGPDYFFQQTVTIVNSLKPLPAPVADTIRPVARFFPEGGNLVKGINSKVAFQVTDQYGKGMHFTGSLINQRNEVVLEFKPLRFGIGHFQFTPAAGDSYTALIHTEDGKTITGQLPTIYDNGYVMRLQEEANGQLEVTVSSNMPARSTKPEEVFLFVHSRQAVKAAVKKTFTNGVARFRLNKDQLGEGISQFTVFNEARQPVCERLYFKQLQQVLSIGATGQATQYDNRKKVDFTLHTSTTGKSVPANLSLSVYRVDSLTAQDQGNILSYLWLSSDLKGTIESPKYYFSSPSTAVTEALDNLMLVHGWRRFNWQDLLTDHTAAFEYIPEFDGHFISGKLTHAVTGAPVSNARTYLSIASTKLQFYPVISNDKGDIRFDVRNYYGPGEIIIQADDENLDSSLHVDIRSPFSAQYSASVPAPLSLSPQFQQTLTEGNINMQVQNAYFSDRLTQFNIPLIDTTPFFGTGYKKYLLDDYVRFTTTEEILREYVPDVAVRKSNGQFLLYIFNWETERHYRTQPLVLLDGVPVSVQKIMTYDPLKMRVLQVVTDRYITGNFTFDGIVSFTTYHGDLTDLKLDNKAVILDYDGLQLQREFYAPVYETPEQAASRLPDFRNVLHWAPDIQTDTNGKAAVQFYTSDLKGKYVAILQGMDSNGHAGTHTFTFEVK